MSCEQVRPGYGMGSEESRRAELVKVYSGKQLEMAEPLATRIAQWERDAGQVSVELAEVYS